MTMQFFPAELKALPQWCVASLLPDADGKPDKRPYSPKTGNPASVTDPRTWGTFEAAIAMREHWRQTGAPNAQVGFVFNKDDPFAVVDLDTYKAKVEGVKQLHAEIIRACEAYTYNEKSQSGLGTHILGRGFVLDGARNEVNCVELYSHARFMICTGDVSGTVAPLADIQDLLDRLYVLIKDGGKTDVANWRELGDGEISLLSDSDIVERAMNAQNSDKFLRLCKGDLSMHNGDWSKADESLIQFFCYYTADNNQVARLFLRSDLALRDKAIRPDYIPRTITYARAKLEKDAPPPLDMTAIAQRAQQVAQNAQREELGDERDDNAISPVDTPKPAPPATRDIVFPPGIVGDIARYVMQAAVRPVPEIALAAGIACFAGVVGRQFNISGTGLNQYILLLAKTGTGKESAQSGIDRLFGELRKVTPAATRFVGPGHFASGPALVKRFSEQPCFVSVVGEFGHKMKTMTHPRANSADKTLMAAMLDVFAKSGWGQFLPASAYSNKENNSDMVHAPTMTLLGETEPEGFFAGLDDATVSSGFLPRFLVIEYTGERPSRNKSPMATPPTKLVEDMTNVLQTVLQSEQKGACVIVAETADAKALLDKFDVFVDSQMRESPNVTRELWNRAHLKALRLAALVAVGVNYYEPCIEASHAEWAITTVTRDIHSLLDRFDRGDVGEGDSKMHMDLVRIIRKYYSVKADKRNQKFHSHGYCAAAFMASRTSNLSAYKNHRLGHMKALKETIATMVEHGELILIDKKIAWDQFKTTALVYCIGDQFPNE